MKFKVVTLFPELIASYASAAMLGRAAHAGFIDVATVNPRAFTANRHQTVDDKPYGGGFGMILRADVLHSAIKFAKDQKLTSDQQKVFLLDPKGEIFHQKIAADLTRLNHLILVCGHYEGFDERILNWVDGRISIGAFISTGGEIPAMLITDSVVRLLKGVLKEGVTKNESHSSPDIFLEHPQYTRPRVYKSLSVPQVLLCGDHKKIEQWKKTNSIKFQ